MLISDLRGLQCWSVYPPANHSERLEYRPLAVGSKGKNKIAAGVALQLAKKEPFIIKKVPKLKDEKVDDALVRISKVLCTNDKELKEKARSNGICVCYLRQKKYLEIDGYLL